MCHGSKEDLTTRRDKTRGGSTENRKERREHREKRKKRGTQVDETDEQTNEPPPPAQHSSANNALCIVLKNSPLPFFSHPLTIPSPQTHPTHLLTPSRKPLLRPSHLRTHSLVCLGCLVPPLLSFAVFFFVAGWLFAVWKTSEYRCKVSSRTPTHYKKAARPSTRTERVRQKRKVSGVALDLVLLPCVFFLLFLFLWFRNAHNQLKALFFPFFSFGLRVSISCVSW